MSPYRVAHCVWFCSHGWRQTQRAPCSVHSTPHSKKRSMEGESMEGEPVLQIVCPQSPSPSRIYPVQSAGRDQSVHLPVTLHRDVSTPPPKPQSAKMWSLSKSQHIFALRKRNAWRQLPRCYHHAKSNPRPKERLKNTFSTQRTLLMSNLPQWQGQHTGVFSWRPFCSPCPFCPCCKNSYHWAELIQLCSPPSSRSCWLLQLLHFWCPALTAALQGVGAAWRKPIKM